MSLPWRFDNNITMQFDPNGGANDPTFTFTDDGVAVSNAATFSVEAITTPAVNTGAVALTIGDGTTTSITFNTDGTGDAEIVLENDSIGDAEIDWSGLTAAADFSMGDFDMNSVDKLEGVDAQVYIDMGGDGIVEIESDTTVSIEAANIDLRVDSAAYLSIDTTDGGGTVISQTSDGTDAITIGDGGDTLTVNAAAGIAMTATATECIMLDASGINCSTTNGCATADTAGTNFDYTLAAFATGADDTGTWTFTVPDNISGTTFVATVHWVGNNASCANAVGDDVCWTVAASGIANDAAWHGATLGTSQGVVDRCLANGDLNVSAATDAITHGWVAGERAIVQAVRDVDAGHADCSADDYDQDAGLLAIKVCYEVDNVFSGE
jgi:hypothetical protein